jgi:hypothetical protein
VIVRLGVVVTVAPWIEGERGPEPLAEKLDVALDSAVTDLKLASDRPGVRILSGPDGPVEGGHALQRKADGGLHT